VKFAEEALADHDLPGLHALAARALMVVAENDETVLEKALEHARKAVAGRAEPKNVLVLADLLLRTGKEDGAVAVLSEHYEKTASPLLAGRLGELAFRTGDYAKAAKALVHAAASDRNAALALALCEGRRGRAKEARAALKHLVKHGGEALAWAGSIELMLGDSSAARKHFAGCDDVWKELAPAICAGYEGKVDEVISIVGEKASEGTREGEEWLLEVAEARLYTKLGKKASAARKLLLEARWAAGKAKVEGAKRPDLEPSVKATSHGFWRRYVTYRRSLDNQWFSPGPTRAFGPAMVDGGPGVGPGVVGRSDCARDAERFFPFNAQKAEEGASITIDLNPNPHNEVWEAASAAFKEGSAAMVAGDMAKADEAFGKALESEPAWGRAKLFQAVAKAVAGTDMDAAATLAKEAIDGLIDDWEGQENAILVLLLAGKDGKPEAKKLSQRLESFSNRRYEELWDEDE
jgi:tetratricopeptide (TPR) repeat protein